MFEYAFSFSNGILYPLLQFGGGWGKLSRQFGLTRYDRVPDGKTIRKLITSVRGQDLHFLKNQLGKLKV